MYENYMYDPGPSDWESLLVGHRIVKAVEVADDAILTLDNGTRIKVRANEGCGGCSNGWYSVTHVAEVDNIITGVRCEVEPVGEASIYSEEYVYRVFVVTAAEEIEAVTVEGDDGNGYYGSGYSLTLLEDLCARRVADHQYRPSTTRRTALRR